MFHAKSLKDAVGERGKTPFAIWMWVLLFALVVPGFQLIHAQASAGLTGTVTDPSGAAIAGAHVTFRNVATGITSQAATSSEIGRAHV